MPVDPLYIRLLEKMGVNVTRLRWKMYQREEKTKSLLHEGPLPGPLKWLSYGHKICRHCGAVADREAKICASCERTLPSMSGYRVARIVSSFIPKDAPIVIFGFLGAAVLVFALQIVFAGMGAILRPPTESSLAFGALAYIHGLNSTDWWRFFAFGLCHGGILHIGFNTYAATQIGTIVESRIGPRRMMALITITQIASALATYFWYNLTGGAFLTVGASGWLMGLIGFGIAHFHQMGDAGKAFRDILIRWTVYIMIFGIVIGANNAAHIGGMVAGLILGILPEGQRIKTPWIDSLWNAAFGMGCVLWTLTVLLMARSVIANFAALTGGG